MNLEIFCESLQNILETTQIKDSFSWIRDEKSEHGWCRLYYFNKEGVSDYNESTNILNYWNGVTRVQVVLDESKVDISPIIYNSKLVNMKIDNNIALFTLRNYGEDEGLLIMLEKRENESIEVFIK